MARLQIVTLPSVTVGSISSPEFLIVFDEVSASSEAELTRPRLQEIRDVAGARGVLVFQGTIEVV